jgi:eukaryotic-like serine/threonine-protein kinase
MAAPPETTLRLLILAADEKTRTRLRAYAVRSWRNAAVQTLSTTLRETLSDPARLQRFDAVLIECNFANEANAEHPTLQALRAASADPRNPPLILLAERGNELTAVQALKFGAADYIPKQKLSRQHIAAAVERALQGSHTVPERGPEVSALELFGYDVRRRLALNGNIAVYVAYSTERGHEVVLKVLHRGSGSLAHDEDFARLTEEFKRLFDIADRAVAEIYDFRATSQYCYIAMEYFPFGSLALKLAARLDAENALAITEEIARALSIIHASGVVHQDLKPANIMLREDGSVALIDFGIARSSQRSATPERKQIMGTPYYMSPEQARGEPTDERTDLYSLGVILYQMLTGQKPYTGETMEAILEQHCEAPIPTLPDAAGGCQNLLERLLAKHAAERVGSARELLELIAQARRGGDVADYTNLGPPPALMSA